MDIKPYHVEIAYRKLKRYVYYDKTDLRLRHRLAEFECSSDFEKCLDEVLGVVNSRVPMNNPTFMRWLEEINFRIVPKSLASIDSFDSDQSENQGKFISNVTSTKYLDVEKVNYFFDGPVELHLIVVLWIMFEGRYLDAGLGKECFGSRLSEQLNGENDESAELFRKYHELYAQWRDTGIKKAKQLLVEDKTSVCILGLDVQEYYYRINLDFSELAKAISALRNEEKYEAFVEGSPGKLLDCLESICVTYRKKVEPWIQQTHESLASINTGIPIGLCSSPILANWYLRPFDKAVKSSVKPAYYGRYIDDILLVVEASEDPSQVRKPVANFIEDVLVNNKLLRPSEDGRYEINIPKGRYLQQSKCILQYFDTKHSIAGLEKFQKKLEKNSSDFLLLPVDEADSSLEDVAYELMYEGSVNKFRSVKGLAENRYELAKNLARQTILHLLTGGLPNQEVSLGLRKFFKGRNAILFHDLWERVFTYFIIANDTKSVGMFERSLRAEINRLRVKGKGEITKLLKFNLESHLSLSRSMGDALEVEDDPLFEGIEGVSSLSFRRANLIRHHFVRSPLLNYTDYLGPLTSLCLKQDINISTEKLRWTPRYVNFDECLLLAESGDIAIHRSDSFDWASKIFESVNGQPISGIKWNAVYSDREDSDV